MRVLVTGANGLVGSRVCDRLVAQGASVVGVSRGQRRAAGRWEYESCDVAEADWVSDVFQRYAPEAVIHCASAADVDACERSPAAAFDDNVVAAARIATQARRAEAHLVHVSTDYVFDGEAGAYGEEDAPRPRGVYALTKHMGEEAVRALAGSWAIARPAVVYGWPAAARANFGSWLVGALAAGKPVRLFEDQLVSPSFAANVAAMIVELAQRRLTGVWHTAGADAVDRVTFGRKLCAVFGFDERLITPVRLAEAGLLAPRPQRNGLKVEKARASLENRPLGLDEALRLFHEEYARDAGA